MVVRLWALKNLHGFWSLFGLFEYVFDIDNRRRRHLLIATQPPTRKFLTALLLMFWQAAPMWLIFFNFRQEYSHYQAVSVFLFSICLVSRTRILLLCTCHANVHVMVNGDLPLVSWLTSYRLDVWQTPTSQHCHHHHSPCSGTAASAYVCPSHPLVLLHSRDTLLYSLSGTRQVSPRHLGLTCQIQYSLRSGLCSRDRQSMVL